MLYASYTIPTASNNKIVSAITNCLIVIFIGHHLGVEKPPPTLCRWGQAMKVGHERAIMLTARIHPCKPDANKNAPTDQSS